MLPQYPVFPIRCLLLLALPLTGVSLRAAQAPTTDLLRWEFVAREPAEAATEPRMAKADGVVAVAGKPIGYLVSRESHADFELSFEWRWTGDDAKPNGGVLLHIPADRPGKVWPYCLQVQLKATDAGSLIPMDGFSIAELPEGAKAVTHRPGVVDAAPGEWNSCRVVCRGDTVTCWINGVLANESTKGSASSGKIGLQLEGAPYEVRNLVLRAVD